MACIGEKANATRPEIEQIMINGGMIEPAQFERDLYVIRRRIEGRTLSLWGEPRVNVLLANLDLDRAFPRR